MRWAGHVARKGEVHTGFFEGKREGKRPPGSLRHRWEDNIKMAPQGMGWGKDWIDLAQGRGRWWAIVNAVMNIRVP
jgi:hypothetical protein